MGQIKKKGTERKKYIFLVAFIDSGPVTLVHHEKNMEAFMFYLPFVVFKMERNQNCSQSGMYLTNSLTCQDQSSVQKPIGTQHNVLHMHCYKTAS